MNNNLMISLMDIVKQELKSRGFNDSDAMAKSIIQENLIKETEKDPNMALVALKTVIHNVQARNQAQSKELIDVKKKNGIFQDALSNSQKQIAELSAKLEYYKSLVDETSLEKEEKQTEQPLEDEVVDTRFLFTPMVEPMKEDEDESLVENANKSENLMACEKEDPFFETLFSSLQEAVELSKKEHVKQTQPNQKQKGLEQFEKELSDILIKLKQNTQPQEQTVKPVEFPEDFNSLISQMLKPQHSEQQVRPQPQVRPNNVMTFYSEKELLDHFNISSIEELERFGFQIL